MSNSRYINLSLICLTFRRLLHKEPHLCAEYTPVKSKDASPGTLFLLLVGSVYSFYLTYQVG